MAPQNQASSVSMAPSRTVFSFTIPTDEYRSQPIPGIENDAKLGHCFVRVTDLPLDLEQFMDVNPRVPSRSKSDVLSGPVVKGIIDTLENHPSDMALMNQGIFLLVEEANFVKLTGGKGQLTITLTDVKKHGIVNGGHTYAAIMDTIESATQPDSAIVNLDDAYVRLHILQGIDSKKVPDIAEGLNTSKQVDDPSLANLKGLFINIQNAMKGKSGEKAIAYNQGDNGDIYISEVLVLTSLFDTVRYSADNHPVNLYNAKSLGLKFFQQGMEKNPKYMDELVYRIPEILVLADKIRAVTKKAAKNVGFELGRAKEGTKDGAKRIASKKHKATFLPFINETVDYRLPNGWLYPMLAAFRANVSRDKDTGAFSWIMPVDDVLNNVIEDLAKVCVSAHKNNGLSPERVGKSESVYSQCYDKIIIYLAKNGKLVN